MDLKNVLSGKVCVLTGAGISAESGVPTFRSGGESVVWKGMPFEEISSANMVRNNLAEVWEWFDYRRGVLSECRPNPAHYALTDIENRCEKFLLVTQNIDGLHQTAGSENVVELHGNINRARCIGCGALKNINSVPHELDNCPKCDGSMRPDVVLFGEMLPANAFEIAAEFAEKCDLCIAVGTSALVYPAASIPQIAKQNGAVLVEINPEETPLSTICDYSYRGPAGEILPELVAKR